MGGDGFVPNNNCNTNSNNNGNKCKRKKKKKKKNGSRKNKITAEQSVFAKSVREWVSLDSSSLLASSSSSSSAADYDGFGVPIIGHDKLVFDFHSHSTCSDGFLSPTALVERAHRNGVKVLALTDHDTMSGIPEAIEAARKYGIKIIPGVEISTIYSPRGESGPEEPVHILAYYSSCGPSRYDELETFLANIREGRYLRAKNMVLKLNKLKMPLKWEHVAKIAGNGVAPGRLHVARALLEAGHVENLKQAFSRYLYDGGPAYSTGSEPSAEEAVKLICQTGGFAALAHPWALKNPLSIIKRLKDVGIHGMEVYRSDGKLAAFSDLADTYGLVKLGGSDYHGRGNHDESDLGSVNLPLPALHEFLTVARPIWCNAIKDILECFAEEPSDMKLEGLTRFCKIRNMKSSSTSCRGKDVVDMCLSTWLTLEERQALDLEALRIKLSHTAIVGGGGVPLSVESA